MCFLIAPLGYAKNLGPYLVFLYWIPAFNDAGEETPVSYFQGL